MNSKVVDIEALEEIERREEISSRSSIISSAGPVIDLDKEETTKVDHLQAVAQGRRTITRHERLLRMSLTYRRACKAAYEASVAAKMAEEIEQD